MNEPPSRPTRQVRQGTQLAPDPGRGLPPDHVHVPRLATVLTRATPLAATRKGCLAGESVIPSVIPPGATPHHQAVSAGRHTRPDLRRRHPARPHGRPWVDL